MFRRVRGRYRREFDLFHDFLSGFYDMHVDEESYFWHASKVTNRDGTNLEAFLDLVGGVSSDEFGSEGLGLNRLDRISRTGTSIAVAASDTDDGADGNFQVLLASPVFSEMLAEGTSLNERFASGHLARAEKPLFDGGLIPSTNGRRWTEAR